MSNGARHGLGLLAGIVAIPALSALLIFGMHRLLHQFRVMAATFQNGSVGGGLVVVGLLAAAGLLIGVLCGSRLSPLASLLPGLALALYGTFWLLRPVQAGKNLRDMPGLKGEYGTDVMQLGQTGLLVVAGAALLFASLPPSRWRSRAAAESIPFNGSTAGPRPAGNPVWGAPPAEPPMASRHEAPPLYDRQDAPAPPHHPGPPAPEPPSRGSGRHAAGGNGPDAKGGEWTQLYGGGSN